MVPPRGTRGGRVGSVGAWRRRQVAWRQAGEQYRCRPLGVNGRVQRGQGIVTPSLRYGDSVMARLPAWHVGPATACLVADRPTMQLAEPLALSLVGPEDPAPHWFVSAAGAHPAATDPGREGAGRDAKILRQLRAPPLVRLESVTPNRMRPAPAQAEPLPERTHR